MSKLHKIALNGTVFWARSGQLLLDAALVNGVELPHDCRAGRCGTCVTRLVAGITVGGNTRQIGMVHACQARVLSDLSIACEKLPPVDVVEARVMQLVDLTEDVVELVVRPTQPVKYFPGQYYRFTFHGFPARAFSPTQPLDGKWLHKAFCLNIKRVRNGRVSTQLGTGIREGHRVSMLGPFGHAFHRPGQTQRLVLVAGGTGFAPIWAIARAALLENPTRPIWIVGGARRLKSLYMAPALELASRFPNVTVVPAVESLEGISAPVLVGSPDSHLPPLTRDDVIYAAGAPVMIDRVAAAASSVGASFYSDPFEPSATDETATLTKIGSWFRAAVSGHM